MIGVSVYAVVLSESGDTLPVTCLNPLGACVAQGQQNFVAA